MVEKEFGRYVVNGLIATFIHYVVLTVNIEWIGIDSAGLSNFLAAGFGISASFIGSRYFVFKKYDVPIILQASKFMGLYGIIAIVHGVILFLWTDMIANDYRVGFLIATTFQVAISYLGNKILVFGE